MTCGKCGAKTEHAATVAACYQGKTFTCDWLVERAWYDPETGDGGVVVVPCGAHAFITDRGWGCEAGHEHVTAEVRHAEGWDYADADEMAAYYAGTFRGGFEPVPMGVSR